MDGRKPMTRVTAQPCVRMVAWSRFQTRRDDHVLHGLPGHVDAHTTKLLKDLGVPESRLFPNPNDGVANVFFEFWTSGAAFRRLLGRRWCAIFHLPNPTARYKNVGTPKNRGLRQMMDDVSMLYRMASATVRMLSCRDLQQRRSSPRTKVRFHVADFRRESFGEVPVHRWPDHGRSRTQKMAIWPSQRDCCRFRVRHEEPTQRIV